MHFLPALLARLTVVPYRHLGPEALRRVADLKLASLAKRLKAQSGAKLVVGPEIGGAIAERCLTAETGARNIDAIMGSLILPKMARAILGRMSSGEPPFKTVTLGLEGGGFSIVFDAEPPADVAGPAAEAGAAEAAPPPDGAPDAAPDDGGPEPGGPADGA
jgi:type VI secretion system protein VasG